MPVTLRPATAADVEVVARIWHDGWRDGHLGHVPDELAAVRTPQSFPPRVAERLDDLEVATVAGVVVGFTLVRDDEVEQVYVDAAARGTGVASVLLAAAARRVADAGHPRAWLAVAAGNARARRFYEREGWRDDGHLRYAAPVPGGTVAVDCRRMVLPLHDRS